MRVLILEELSPYAYLSCAMLVAVPGGDGAYVRLDELVVAGEHSSAQTIMVRGEQVRD